MLVMDDSDSEAGSDEESQTDESEDDHPMLGDVDSDEDGAPDEDLRALLAADLSGSDADLDETVNGSASDEEEELAAAEGESGDIDAQELLQDTKATIKRAQALADTVPDDAADSGDDANAAAAGSSGHDSEDESELDGASEDSDGDTAGFCKLLTCLYNDRSSHMMPAPPNEDDFDAYDDETSDDEGPVATSAEGDESDSDEDDAQAPDLVPFDQAARSNGKTAAEPSSALGADAKGKNGLNAATTRRCWRC